MSGHEGFGSTITIDKATTFKTTIGFILLLIGALVAVTTVSVSRGYDIDILKAQRAEDHRELVMLRDTLMGIQSEMRVLGTTLVNFREEWNRDQNRYIRDFPKQNR